MPGAVDGQGENPLSSCWKNKVVTFLLEMQGRSLLVEGMQRTKSVRDPSSGLLDSTLIFILLEIILL